MTTGLSVSTKPHVRPIVRGKQNKAVEFGAKLGVSLSGDGIACVDHLSWDAYHEGHDLPAQVEAYRKRHGHYPEKLLADPLYGTRDNRKFLKEKGIRFAGKPLGRRPKMTSAEDNINRRQRQQDYRERIPIEGKFGQGKNGYDLNYIRARTAKTSEAWIRSIFLVMNLLVLIRFLFVWTPTLMEQRVATVLATKFCRLNAAAGHWVKKTKTISVIRGRFLSRLYIPNVVQGPASQFITIFCGNDQEIALLFDASHNYRGASAIHVICNFSHYYRAPTSSASANPSECFGASVIP